MLHTASEAKACEKLHPPFLILKASDNIVDFDTGWPAWVAKADNRGGHRLNLEDFVQNPISPKRKICGSIFLQIVSLNLDTIVT